MKGSNILLLADSPVAPFFAVPDRMDHIKLPSIRKVSAGCWEATRLQIDGRDLVKLRANILRNALLNFRPDLLLVDHMPAGAKGELLASLRALKRVNPKCSIVLGLRDILDAPEVTRRVWESDGAYDAVRQYYDCILVYGSKDVFDTIAVYHVPTPVAGAHYCGYVVKQDPVRCARRVLQAAHIRNRRFVFVSAGGGGDGQSLMQSYVRAVRILGSKADFVSLMAVGVNAPPAFTSELAIAARGLPIRIVPYVDDSPSCIAAADLVVCMAGYNTVSEVLYLKKKALVIPRSGPSAEQTTRARILAERRLIDFVHPVDLSPEALAQRLAQDLETSAYPIADATLPMDGATHAASRLMTLLQETTYAVSA